MEVNTQTNDVERILIEKFKAAKEKRDQLKIDLDAANEDFDKIEAELMQLLDDQNKKSSPVYRDLGHVTCVEPTPYAQIKSGEEQKLFASLREIGREDLIKTAVNTSALSGLVRQCLKEKLPIPEGCTYYLKRRLQFTPYKG